MESSSLEPWSLAYYDCWHGDFDRATKIMAVPCRVGINSNVILLDVFGKIIIKESGPIHSNWIYHAKFLGSSLLVTCAFDRTVKIWKLPEFSLMTKWNMKGKIYSIDTDLKDRIFAAGDFGALDILSISQSTTLESIKLEHAACQAMTWYEQLQCVVLCNSSLTFYLVKISDRPTTQKSMILAKLKLSGSTVLLNTMGIDAFKDKHMVALGSHDKIVRIVAIKGSKVKEIKRIHLKNSVTNKIGHVKYVGEKLVVTLGSPYIAVIDPRAGWSVEYVNVSSEMMMSWGIVPIIMENVASAAILDVTSMAIGYVDLTKEIKSNYQEDKSQSVVHEGDTIFDSNS